MKKSKKFESVRIFKQYLNPDRIPDRTESWSGPEFGPDFKNVQKFLFDQKSFQMSLVRDSGRMSKNLLKFTP